jgi:luciferase family oxidoreductase group 1
LYGAQLAAVLGLPYAFASHFAPDALDQALREYRSRFEPSDQLSTSYAMPCVNAIVADTDEQAQRLFTSIQQRFTDMVRNQRGKLAAPIDNIEEYWNAAEKAHAQRMLACSFVGSKDTVRAGLNQFIERTGADELMVSAAVFDHDARLRSYELLAQIGNELDKASVDTGKAAA